MTQQKDRQTDLIFRQKQKGDAPIIHHRIQKPLVCQQQQVWWKDCFKIGADRRHFEDRGYGMEVIYSGSDQDCDSRDQRRRHSGGHRRHLKHQTRLEQRILPIFLFVKWEFILLKSEVTVEGRTKTVLFCTFRARLKSVLRWVNEAVKAPGLSTEPQRWSGCWKDDGRVFSSIPIKHINLLPSWVVWPQLTQESICKYRVTFTD